MPPVVPPRRRPLRIKPRGPNPSCSSSSSPLPLLGFCMPSAMPGVPITMEPSSSSPVVRQTWELENNIAAAATDLDAQDEIYRYYTQAHQEKPWGSDLHHFCRARISALALLKMFIHARAGGTIEIMGLMQGKFKGDSIIIMDAFTLPVEGTETRVNA